MKTIIAIQLLFVMLTFLLSVTTRIEACSCLVWPTFDTMIQDETTYMFRGRVVPRFLSSTFSFSSLLSSLWSNDRNDTSQTYTVRVQRVFKNGCIGDNKKISSHPLSEGEIITIVSPQNSCGINQLPMFRSFLISGTMSTSDQGRARSLQQPQELTSYNSDISITDTSNNNNNNVIQNHVTVRRRTESSDVTTLDANVCNALVQLWREVTRAERNTLSSIEANISTNTSQFECSNGNL